MSKVSKCIAFSKVLHSRLGADSPAGELPAETVWDILFAVAEHGGRRLAIGGTAANPRYCFVGPGGKLFVWGTGESDDRTILILWDRV